jgi:hypothetical protein
MLRKRWPVALSPDIVIEATTITNKKGAPHPMLCHSFPSFSTMAPVVSRLVARPYKFAEGASIKYSYRDKRFWGMLESCKQPDSVLVLSEGSDRSSIYRSETGQLLGRQRQASGKDHISHDIGPSQ